MTTKKKNKVVKFKKLNSKQRIILLEHKQNPNSNDKFIRQLQSRFQRGFTYKKALEDIRKTNLKNI